LGTDDGSYAADYQTYFANTTTDAEDATISYLNTGNFIAGSPIWLLAKGGGGTPTVYLWDLTDIWNGTETLEIRDLWLGRGAISNVQIWTGPSHVPDAGTTLVLLGAGMIGIGAMRRRLSK